MSTYECTIAGVRKYLTAYHHLTASTALKSHDDVPAFVRRVGCIQFDPLEAVGRNADLVLQSRLTDYRRGDLAHKLYTERMLFDVWDKNMAICAVEDWPYFKRFRRRYDQYLHEFAEPIKKITAYLHKHESACSSDFPFEDKVSWWYGHQRVAKAALECMCYAGLAIVHHKRGTRRYYALAERFIPTELYHAPEPNPTDEEYYQWLVLRRINSIGILWNRPGDAWLGIYDFKANERNAAFATLLTKQKIVEVKADGLKYPLFIDRNNLELLENVRDEAPQCRFIAPLDNMIWERKLIQALFDFDYKWEVYTPAPQRKYGYYVLPVLYGDHFIGRIEFTRTPDKSYQVKNLWPEKTLRKTHKNAIDKALQRFSAYAGTPVHKQ